MLSSKDSTLYPSNKKEAMMATVQKVAKQRKKSEPETLRRHRKMYEERLEEIKWRRGLSEKRILDFVNSPNAYRTKKIGAKS